VQIYLRALDALHGVRTTVTISADGIGSTGGLSVGISSTLPAIAGVTDEVVVTTTSQWPCPHCGDMAEHIYGGLYKHDYGIGQAYQQQKWPV
jgi:hypothetical protein